MPMSTTCRPLRREAVEIRYAATEHHKATAAPSLKFDPRAHLAYITAQRRTVQHTTVRYEANPTPNEYGPTHHGIYNRLSFR